MQRKIEVNVVKDNQMKAVHDNDLKKLLESLGVYENVIAGNYQCLFCGRIITLDNIDSIVPHKQSIQFTCDHSHCHLKLIGWRK